MTQELSQKIKAERWFFILAGIFIASLVACNLTFQKFFFWQPFSFLDFGSESGSFWFDLTHYRFEVSVGIIPYPVTFLVTDIISEIYGRRRADQVVLAGLVSSAFVLLIVWVSMLAPATEWSPVSDELFNKVFGSTAASVGASMAAYLLAQFIDIRIFHFWKRLTKGKHLWLRNNFSTIPSQFFDTFTVLLVLSLSGVIPWDKFGHLLLNGFIFKVIIAFLDTPFFYLSVFYFRKKFSLKENEEVVF